MKKLNVSILLCFALAGCATGPYGNYLDKAAGVNQYQLATDTINKLVTLYPPAKVSLELKQETPDEFGMALVKGLRESGYSVLEFNPSSKKIIGSTTALPLSYVVDQAGDSGFYRLTIKIGSQSLTRPYMNQGGNLAAAGYWARKE